jgi:cystathionine beta-synthase
MTAPRTSAGVLPLIGDTPLVQVTHLDTGPCELWLKLESANPGGSIKDRCGRSMIDAAEQSGELKPGGHIVEATAGNTGLGLALVAALRGYKLTLVLPDTMSQEKVLHLKALGAQCVLTRSDVGKGHPQHYQSIAPRIARETGAWYVNQCENAANPRAHEETTGPEIWAQMDHRLDAVVCGVGSGGTITGLSRFFARVAPGVEMILADPVGSVVADFVRTGKVGTAGSWLVEGIGEDFIPPICDLSRVKKAYSISDNEAFAVVRQLLRAEGILAGTSSGVLIAAALRWCREQTEPRRVVTLVCDSGGKYLSKAYNDTWMDEHGLTQVRPATGDLRDLVARRARDGHVIHVGPEDTLAVAYARMRASDVSQLPVLDGKKLVGIIDESDLLLALLGDAARGAASFQRPVVEVMSLEVETLAPTAGVHQLLPLFDRGMVGIVVDGDELLGLVTRVDLLNYLRRRAG